MRILLIVVVLSLLLPAAHAQSAGTVVDPQGLPVPGARVTVTCAEEIRKLETDSRGRFTFTPRTTACDIVVARDGFENLRTTRNLAGDSLVLQLQLAPLEQFVRVTGEQFAEDPLLRSTIASTSLSIDELAKVSNNTSEMIRYAKLVAGTMNNEDVVHVDGLPGGTLPPAHMVSRIVVNGNPFSAQYGGGNQNFVDVITRRPDRKLRFSFGGTPPAIGGADILTPGLRSSSKSGNASLRGPVPFLPASFSLRTNFSRSANEPAILAVLPSDVRILREETRTRSASAGGDIYFAGRAFRGTASFNEMRNRGFNQGIGGLTLPEAGSRSMFANGSARLGINWAGSGMAYRGSVSAGRGTSTLTANRQDGGVSVLGAFLGGGANFLTNESRRSDWAATQIIESKSARPSWLAGVSVSRVANRSIKQPNARGMLQFESFEQYDAAQSGAKTGTWYVTRGNGDLQHAVVNAAPYVQKTLLAADNMLIAGGLRVEYQSGMGTSFAPRLTAAREWRGFVLRGGVGVFMRSISNDVFMRVLGSNSQHLQQYVVPEISFDDIGRVTPDRDIAIHSRFAGSLGRSRQVLLKTSGERSWRKWTPAVEYTFARDRGLLGSRRIPDGTTWTDVVESNRSAERHEVHARLGYQFRQQTFVGHYQWTRARDNGDGPFSYAQNWDDLAAEWSRSSSIAPHSIVVVGNLSLPRAISLTLTGSWQSSAPYNITTGIDRNRNGLYNDRGGRSRNSGDGPSQSNVTLYASRRVSLPLPAAAGVLRTTVGIQADNLLGARNYMGFGSIAGSSTFGKPIAAYPGRSIAFWLSVD